MSENKRPKRYKLYDKLKVTKKQVDVLIYVCIALVALCVVIGVFMR